MWVGEPDYDLLLALALVVSLFLIEVKDKKQTSFLKTTETNTTINAGVKGADSIQRAGQTNEHGAGRGGFQILK